MHIFILLGALFVSLKLGGVIAWSWWLVTLPFWVDIAIAGAPYLSMYIAALLAGSYYPRRRKW
jgi:hypothetical protein